MCLHLISCKDHLEIRVSLTDRWAGQQGWCVDLHVWLFAFAEVRLDNLGKDTHTHTHTHTLLRVFLIYVVSLVILILGQSNFLACSSQKNSTHKTNDTPEVFLWTKGRLRSITLLNKCCYLVFRVSFFIQSLEASPEYSVQVWMRVFFFWILHLKKKRKEWERVKFYQTKLSLLIRYSLPAWLCHCLCLYECQTVSLSLSIMSSLFSLSRHHSSTVYF